MLPEKERIFKIGRASKEGTGKGIGQSNIWFAESEYAKEQIIPEVLKFIRSHKENRINTMIEEFLDYGNRKPLTEKELEYANTLADEEGK